MRKESDSMHAKKAICIAVAIVVIGTLAKIKIPDISKIRSTHGLDVD